MKDSCPTLEESQSLPLPLVTVVHAARQAVASATVVPRTITLSGPPLRIPALPVVSVAGAAPASDVQLSNTMPPAEKPSNESGAWSPQRWGRYETLCEIGRGGMGTVYLCRSVGDAGFQRLFAVKALRADLSRDPAQSRLFLEQARITARLHHPNVVSTLDVGVRDGQPYLVMDYVEGLSLSGLLDRDRARRSPLLLIPIFLDVLRGLQAAHELADDDGTPLELVHCDVSPQNVLVGSDGAARITDFGVARARGMPPQTTRGKPGFLSPEQLIGETVDRRSDLFSLGTLMWCALTGEHLFHASTLEATLTNVIRRRIEPPSEVGLRPPACLDAIVLKALERDPEYRFRSAAEMLEALHAVAVEHDFLPPKNPVPRWVEQCFTREHERRQLAVLEGGRGGADPGPRRADAGTEKTADLDLSSTLALPRTNRQRRLLALALVAISLLAIGLSLTFSPALSRRSWLSPAPEAPPKLAPVLTGDPP